MNKHRKIKKLLRDRYFFQQKFSADMVQMLLSALEPSNYAVVAATLTVGCVRLEAVIYWDKGRNHLGYDLMVKDTPESPNWICYESLPDEVRYNVWNLEREMFQVLDRTVEQYGLSYTECRFLTLSGGAPKPK